MVIGFSTMPSMVTVQGRTGSACAALGDVLARAELVVVVVAGRIGFRRDRPVELVARVLLHRIERGRGIGSARRRAARRATRRRQQDRRRRRSPGTGAGDRAKTASGVAADSGSSQPRLVLISMATPPFGSAGSLVRDSGAAQDHGKSTKGDSAVTAGSVRELSPVRQMSWPPAAARRSCRRAGRSAPAGDRTSRRRCRRPWSASAAR